jgi:hypothetical protein
MSFLTTIEHSLDKAIDAAYGDKESMTKAEIKLALLSQAPPEKKPRAPRKKAEVTEAVAEKAATEVVTTESGTEEVKTVKEKKPRAPRKKAGVTEAPEAAAEKAESGTDEVKTEKKPRASKKKAEPAPEGEVKHPALPKSDDEVEPAAPKKGAAKKADEPKPNLAKLTPTLKKSFEATATELKVSNRTAESFLSWVNALSADEYSSHENKALMRKFLENSEYEDGDKKYLYIKETNALYLKDPTTNTYSFAGINGQGELDFDVE